jgi:hypothetical protein
MIGNIERVQGVRLVSRPASHTTPRLTRETLVS